MTQMIRIFLFIFISAVLSGQALHAQDSTQSKQRKQRQRNQLKFVDKNGDGYNDLLPDHDGDGIPNSLDPDWQRMHKKNGPQKKARFIDLDGDGINDLLFSGEGKNKQVTPMGDQQPAGAMGEQNGYKQKGRHGHGKGRK